MKTPTQYLEPHSQYLEEGPQYLESLPQYLESWYLAQALDHLTLMDDDMDTRRHIEEELYRHPAPGGVFQLTDNQALSTEKASVFPPREDFFPYGAV